MKSSLLMQNSLKILHMLKLLLHCKHLCRNTRQVINFVLANNTGEQPAIVNKMKPGDVGIINLVQFAAAKGKLEQKHIKEQLKTSRSSFLSLPVLPLHYTQMVAVTTD